MVALAGVLIVMLVGGGAMANAVVGPPSNQEDPGSDNVTNTPTRTATSTAADTSTRTATPSAPNTSTPTATPTAPDTPTPETTTPTDPTPFTDDPPIAADDTDANEPPAPRFIAINEPLVAGENVSFTASPASDPDGEIVSYEWDFGDGETATGEDVTHAYAEPGEYTVSLTATDDDGATTTWTNNYTVGEGNGSENELPTVYPVADSLPLTAGNEEGFRASTVPGHDGGVLGYEWDFGDGGTGTGTATTHTYEEPGTYEVTLTLTGEDGETASQTREYTVREQPEVVPQICHPFNGFEVGEEIQFRGSQFYGQEGPEIERYEWDFGTGTVGDNTTYHAGNATGSVVTQTYDNPGVFTVTLTVTTTDMVTANTSVEVHVGYPRSSHCPTHQRPD